MGPDAHELQNRYAGDLIAWLRSKHKYPPSWDSGYLTIVRWYWEGDPPNSELKILFRVADRPCLYGLVDRPWDEGYLDVCIEDVDQVVGSTEMRWLEGLMTGELPHKCSPDSDGVTWLSLWEDW